MDNVQISINDSKYNNIAFWILGLCNNFAYVVMLSAAKDIIDNSKQIELPCREHLDSRDCHQISTGSVLLADIIPALVIKLSSPLFIHFIPFGIRHFIVVILQFVSFLIVATSQTQIWSLFGVVLASFGSGLGEVTYLSLTSFYPSKVVSYWSSGTGGAGIIGAVSYAFLTDSKFLSLQPRNAMYIMLLVPILFSYTYVGILKIPRNVQRVNVCDFSIYFVTGSTRRQQNDRSSLLGDDRSSEEEEPEGVENEERRRNNMDKMKKIIPLLPFMIPLILVYYAEYYINQGMLELIEFDCSNSLSLGANSQYRWFQVMYQLGVFVSRSSSDLFPISFHFLPYISVLQILNSFVFTSTAIYHFLPHILIAFLLIFLEGILGGASYVNTFRAVHEKIPIDDREFSMGVVSISDTIGIVAAGFTSIPVHNYICSLQY